MWKASRYINKRAGINRPERTSTKKMLKKIIKLYIIAIPLTIAVALLIVANAYAEDAIEVPEEIKEISEELGQAYNICPEVIQAMCYVESRFKANAENDGCIGVMQVYEKWHKERMQHLGVTDLTDPRQNMTVAVDYLSELVADGEDMEEALMRYHGESGINEKLNAGEMSDYVAAILELAAELERQNGK